LSQWAWVNERIGDVESDFSVLHRVDNPVELHPQRFIDLAWRLSAYQGAVRRSLELEAADDDQQAPADLSEDRVIDSEYAAADPILGQFVEVGRVEVID
jgi:hypothetical protein